MNSEDRDPEIKVTDRRRFSADGEPLATAEEEEQAPRPAAPPPQANFEFLVLSLRWQAELQLGLHDTEPEGEQARDLEGARYTIDLLAVLQQKTKGNLTLHEQRLLDNSVTELRFRYVQVLEQAGKKQP